MGPEDIVFDLKLGDLKALVAPHLVDLESLNDELSVQRHTAQMLAHALCMKPTIGFVGSGLSLQLNSLIETKYPSWQDLALSIVLKTLEELKKTDGGVKNGYSNYLLGLLLELGSFPSDKYDMDHLPDYNEIRSPEKQSKTSSSESLFVAFSECERIRKRFHMTDLRQCVCDYIHEATGTCDTKTFYTEAKEEILLGPISNICNHLGIYRYMTINYDLEIERALRHVWNINSDNLKADQAEYGGGASAKHFPELVPPIHSISVDSENVEALALFAVGAPGYDIGVFHCHGSIENYKSMIVTEKDYQNIYLREAQGSQSYQEFLDIALSSNAVIFFGVGMNETDLLRPLRRHVSNYANARHRPLFALMECPKDVGKAILQRKRLYDQYGLKVLYYSTNFKGLSDNEKEIKRRECFLATIKRLSDFKSDWWNSLQKRPPMRLPPEPKKSEYLIQGKFYIRHEITSTNNISLKNFDKGSTADSIGAHDDIRTIYNDIETSKGGLLGLILGFRGSGKGSIASSLTHLLHNNQSTYEATFFATTHFSNEFLSIIESAANLFSGISDEKIHPATRLAKALVDKKCLLVLGGLERVLIESQHTEPTNDSELSKFFSERNESLPFPLGRPVSAEIRIILAELMDAARSENGNSHIILTSALWPNSYMAENVNDNFKFWITSGIDLGSFVRVSKNLLVGEGDRSGGDRIISDIKNFHHSMRGHTYALKIFLNTLGFIRAHDERLTWFNRVLAEVSRRGIADRASYVISEVLFLFNIYEELSSEILKVLLRASLSSTPVGETELSAAISTDKSFGLSKATLKYALNILLKWGLLEKIKATHDYIDHYRYTAHSAIRAAIFPPGQVQRFVLPGFAEQGDESQILSAKTHNLSVSVMEELVDLSWETGNEMSVHEFTHLNSYIKKHTINKRRALLRAAFGVMRARWNAIGLPRLTLSIKDQISTEDNEGYDLYLQQLSRIANTGRTVPGQMHWRYALELKRKDVEIDGGMFYCDELAWLANELGLVYFIQGGLNDSLSWFRAGKHIHTVAERFTKSRRYRQSELNIGAVLLEQGHLYRAKKHIENTLNESLGDGDDEMAARARGFLGMIAHLSGDFKLASKFYKISISDLSKFENYRGQSIFYRLYADLQRIIGKKNKASDMLAMARSTAELGGHLDLLHYARVAAANLDTDKDTKKIMAELLEAQEFARKLRIPKLEADTGKVMSSIALRIGDLDRAARLARRSLSIAAENGMGLRVTSNLVMIGHIAREREQFKVANQVYRSAIALGRRQGYFLQADIAQRYLFDSPPGIK